MASLQRQHLEIGHRRLLEARVAACVNACMQRRGGMGPGLLPLPQQHCGSLVWFMTAVALSGSVYGFP